MPPRRRRRPARGANGPLRAVLYLRQSQAKEESISLELQEESGRRHCARKGYAVVAVLEDEGISGRRWENRPRAAETVRMIEDDEADVGVSWRWSRFSRNRVNFDVANARVENAGGRFEASEEDIDTSTSTGRFHRGLHVDLAEMQSDAIGEGWRDAHRHRREAGMPHAGGDRYGYTRVRRADGKVTGYAIDEGDDGDPTTDPPRPPRLSPAEALRLAYRWYLEGWGAVRIAAELNRRGYRNLRGTAFKRASIYPLLDAGFAAGRISHQERDRDGNLVGDLEHLPGTHPPIIDEATWEAYVAARRARAATPAATSGSRHVLSGLMRCGDCGSAMSATNVAGRSRRTVWACALYRNLGGNYVRGVTVGVHLAEAAAREWLAGIASDVEAAAAADNKVRRRHRTARSSAATARARAETVEGQLAALSLGLVRGEVSRVGYDTARRELEGELERWRTAAEEAEAVATQQPVSARSTAGRLLEAWGGDGEAPLMTAADLRHGLGLLVQSVWVFPRGNGRPADLHVVPVWEDPPAPNDPDAAARARRGERRPDAPRGQAPREG